MPTERRRAYYEGRVQGVGFRFTAQRLAVGLSVNGYVRNLPDGRVELLSEGEPTSLDALSRAIRSEMGDRVHSVSEGHEEAGDPPFPDFSIHY